MNQEARVDYLITYLAKENPQAYEQLKRKPINKFELFRGLVNVRKAEPVTDEFIQIQNAYLTEINYDKTLTSIHDLRSEEHTSELQSRGHLVCRLLLEK